MAKETKVKVLFKSGRTQLALVSLLDCHCHSVLPSLLTFLKTPQMLMTANGGGFIQRLPTLPRH